MNTDKILHFKHTSLQAQTEERTGASSLPEQWPPRYRPVPAGRSSLCRSSLGPSSPSTPPRSWWRPVWLGSEWSGPGGRAESQRLVCWVRVTNVQEEEVSACPFLQPLCCTSQSVRTFIFKFLLGSLRPGLQKLKFKRTNEKVKRTIAKF